MLASDGTNVYFAQYSSNNAYQMNLNTVFVLATGSPLTYAGCDSIASAQGYFWCEGSGLYNTFDDQLSQFGLAWAPHGNNPGYYGYYSNSTSTPLIYVMTTGPNGVFFGSSPTTLYSLTNIRSQTLTTYTPLSFPQVGSFNGLATNANGDLFVADSHQQEGLEDQRPGRRGVDRQRDRRPQRRLAQPRRPRLRRELQGPVGRRRRRHRQQPGPRRQGHRLLGPATVRLGAATRSP